MSKLLNYLFASGAFLRALVTRRDPVKGHSQSGHALIEGWDHAPEDEIIRQAYLVSRKSQRPATVALFGYDGPARGELIPLRGSVLTVGTATTNQIVLTPAANRAESAGPYPFDLSEGITVSAPLGQRVKVNGREEEKCELYDYDRVELAGNHFLVLEMGR